MTGRHTSLAAAREGPFKERYLPKIDSCAITQLTTEVPKLVTSIAVGCSLCSRQEPVATEVLNKAWVFDLTSHAQLFEQETQPKHRIGR